MSQEIDYFFDPVCPFCWMTSKWVRQVQGLKDLHVNWRYISLAILNEQRPDSKKTAGHDLGLRLLRIADAVGDEAGNDAVGRYYERLGSLLWETAPDRDGVEERAGKTLGRHHHAMADRVPEVLEAIGLSPSLVAAGDDETRDDVLRKSTDLALDRTGGDVGTPVITFAPPDGPSFFGPVISRLAGDDEALELWDAVSTLARWPSFAELKRSLRETPDTILLRAVTEG